jgi:hypothetical protein
MLPEQASGAFHACLEHITITNNSSCPVPHHMMMFASNRLPGSSVAHVHVYTYEQHDLVTRRLGYATWRATHALLDMSKLPIHLSTWHVNSAS